MEIFLIFIRYTAAVGAIVASGYALLLAAERLFLRGEPMLPPLERWFLSFPVGSLFLAFYMFWLGLLKIPFGVVPIGAFFVFPVAVGIFSARYRRTTPNAMPNDAEQKKATRKDALAMNNCEKLLAAVMAVLLAGRLAFVLFEIAFVPTFFEDSAAQWNHRAKILYQAKGFLLDRNSPDFFGKYRPEYPLYTHLNKIYLSTAAGGWYEPVVNSLNVLVLVSLAGFIAFFLARVTGHLFGAAGAAYVISTIPLATYQLFGGLYSDFLFGLFLLGSLALFFAWTRNTTHSIFLFLSALLFSASLFTKIDPLVLALGPMGAALALCVFREKTSRVYPFVLFFGVILAFIGPWVALKVFYGIPLLPTGAAPGKLVQIRLDLVPHMGKVLLFQGSFNVFFAALPALLLVVWKHLWRPPLLYSTIFCALFLGMILFVFLFTGSSQWLEDQTTFNRTMVAYLPSLIFLLAIGIGNALKKPPIVRRSRR